jgi:hypothetical protein
MLSIQFETKLPSVELDGTADILNLVTYAPQTHGGETLLIC